MLLSQDVAIPLLQFTMRFDFIVVQLKSTHSSTLIHILTENLSDLVTDCDVLDYIFRDRDYDSFLTFSCV